jgi:hypothetical protein
MPAEPAPARPTDRRRDQPEPEAAAARACGCSPIRSRAGLKEGEEESGEGHPVGSKAGSHCDPRRFHPLHAPTMSERLLRRGRHVSTYVPFVIVMEKDENAIEMTIQD